MIRPTRREMLGAVVGGAASVPLLSGCSPTPTKTRIMAPNNADYYQADGTFDAERAKQAYYAMMEYHGYPIVERLRGDEFWTLDFGLGQFHEVGMAGIFWINNKDHNYMGHEIYLLPGQMIPEHWHLETPDAQAKVEAWQLRCGQVSLFSEGEPTAGVEAHIPPLHREIAVARTELALAPGEVGYLAKPTEKHWMLAGPEGAIVTEYASYHDMAGLRFTHPGITL